eukprot:9295446-Pyramimonas_sp.AAC.1
MFLLGRLRLSSQVNVGLTGIGAVGRWMSRPAEHPTADIGPWHAGCSRIPEESLRLGGEADFCNRDPTRGSLGFEWGLERLYHLRSHEVNNNNLMTQM